LITKGIAGLRSNDDRDCGTADADYVVGEATPAYPWDVGLESFKRHVLFIKEDSP
jgi:hypothetical protein